MAEPPVVAPDRREIRRTEATGLADLLDRVVARGVSVSGDLIIGLAGVDLIRVDLRLLLVAMEGSLERDRPMGTPR